MQPPIAAVSTEFKDRKTGLIVFGIFTMLLGGLCALFVPLMFFAQGMSVKAGGPDNTQMMAPAIAMYGGLAVVLIWLGIGSMMARRWASALLLIFSWSWLLIGVVSVAVTAYVLPLLMETINASKPPGQPELPAAAKSLILVMPMIILGVIFVILPSVWVLFYKSGHVKATCEARDPIERWTDRCPLPVIAICLWLALCVPMMLLMAVAYKGVFPFFGTFVVGPLGSAVYVLFAVIWAYAAWALYKLDIRGWWIVVASVTIFSVSAFITYSRHDFIEIYALMGYPEQQIAQIQQFTFFKGQKAAWLSLVGTVPLLAYMLYLKRFFKSLPD
jgi:hypothetical protein